MNLTKMLEELRSERQGVEQAIFVLERIASGRGKRRGRPPKWMTGAVPPAPDGAKTFTRRRGHPRTDGCGTAETVETGEKGDERLTPCL
jgi:hypothetical protein